MNTVNDKIEFVDGVEYRYSSEWTHKLESEQHWRLYWHQQSIMQGLVLPGQAVLEIGHGSGFTSNYLRSKGVSVTTFDIDPDKKPDILGNIVTFSFDQIYDHFLAFELFEHIPYDQFEKVLHKIARACRGYLFLSVPRAEKIVVDLSLKLPFIRRINLEIPLHRSYLEEKHHFWEIDYGPTTRAKFKETVEGAGFKITHTEKVFSRLFFVLKSPTK
jgi:SAM-dependent methyltransferase